MKLQYSVLPLLFLGAVSCDKAKEIVRQAEMTVKSEIAKNTAPVKDETIANPELQSQVDQDADGAIFRKDLPFPRYLKVNVTRVHEVVTRTVGRSEIELEKKTVRGTETLITQFERKADQVSYTRSLHQFQEPIPPNTDPTKAPPVKVLAPPAAPCLFVKSGSKWKHAGNDFRSASLAQTISPHFDQLLIENCLSPRELWLGKQRFKVGDQLPVSGNFLPMIVAGSAKGKLLLTLEAFEAVNGHPCGVFAISGDYNRSKAPDFEGKLTDEEVTISSGKIWLSLLYPVILKEELETIQSYKSGGQGGLVNQGQGSVKVSVTRDWVPVAP
ncbi:MAG: hypothetical protein HC845_11765 [Akkermansiaceae bacterium]|nr:hypothetical protein [Akkermansiaceae bacterium]